jgi:pSer/pThr/pTyr-binding forkhead associated (FHA) protein
MPILKLPAIKTAFADRPCSEEVINSFFTSLQGRLEPTSLILTAPLSQDSLLLFILGNRPYAAGRLTGDRFEALTLRDYFKALSEAGYPAITLHETNPVLFKCLLVLVQKEPTITGTTDLVNVEALLKRLKTSKQEAVVSQKRDNELNLFYFAKGKLFEGYFADPSAVSKESAPDDQFLEYAYTATTAAPVTVESYEDIQVGPAEDHDLAWEETPVGIVGYFLKPRPELVFLSEGSTVEKKTINKKIFTLGRDPKSDILLNDTQVSRDHAVIRETGGAFILEDKASRNGTFVNDQKVGTIKLSDGDEIRIGRTRILFMDKPQEAAKAVPSQKAGPEAALEMTMLKMDEAVLQEAAVAVQPPRKGLSLQHLNGPQQGTITPLKGKMIIGRSKADINTHDPKVSRQHASIDENPDGFHFSDLNSTNGSFVNDQPVRAKILVPGDIIQVGDSRFKVMEGDQAS